MASLGLVTNFDISILLITQFFIYNSNLHWIKCQMIIWVKQFLSKQVNLFRHEQLIEINLSWLQVW